MPSNTRGVAPAVLAVVRAHLDAGTASRPVIYVRSRDVAGELGLNTRSVAAALGHIARTPNGLTVAPNRYVRSTIWRVERRE